MTIDLSKTRKAFLQAVDAAGTDMIDVQAWAPLTHEQRQNPFLKRTSAYFFRPDTITLGSMGRVFARTHSPELAIFLMASVVEARQVLVEAMIAPKINYQRLRFSTSKKALDPEELLEVMPKRDHERWLQAYRQSLSHHGQIELMARLPADA